MYSEQQAAYLVNTSSKIIKLYYACQELNANNIGEIPNKKIGELVKEVCVFYDTIKDFNLDVNQLKFLYRMSNIIGIPHYYDMLCNHRNGLEINDVDLNTFKDLLYNCSLYIDEENALHKYQKQVIDYFTIGEKNRYFLTAPTSFGKTFIVFEIIKKMQYRNIVLIFPTLSLLAENYAKLLKSEYFRNYKIHTLSNFDIEPERGNIWIYTPERFMTMTDKYNLNFDFIFMDEVYKIDNKFILDNETVGENERDTAYRIALEITCKRSHDFLLAGPYINIPDYSKASSIVNFFKDNRIQKLNYNDIEIVDKEVVSFKENGDYSIDGITISISNMDKNKRLNRTIEKLNTDNCSSIVYVNSRYAAETTAKQISKTRKLLMEQDVFNFTKVSLEEKQRFIGFVSHLYRQFSKKWTLIQCLRKRIGIHHGYIPKYIQKELIHFFNIGILDCIVSTTTITEGVNTSAKNMIVMSDEKGDKPLKKFDAQNIAGRAGRFIYHYKGRVVAINNNFQSVLSDENESYLNHIDYDITKDKNEVDIMIAPDKYLTDKDKKTKKDLLQEAEELGIPSEIIEQFKAVPLRDKITLYKSMKLLSKVDILLIQQLIQELNYTKLNWDGFEVLLKYIKCIVKNSNLLRLIETKTGSLQKYCALTVKVHSYIQDGFQGIFNYEKKQPNTKTDTAVRKAAELSFNLFRYHLVKYLGIFDLIFRHIEAIKKNCSADEIYGIGVLLQLLEYSSKTPEGKIVSDYGVPFNVLHYIDTHNSYLKSKLDQYELETLKRLKELFNIE